METSKSTAVVLLVAIVALVGVPNGVSAGSKLPKTPAQLSNPCSLVTKAEAQAIIGRPVTQGNAVKTVCTYTATGDGGNVAVTLGSVFCKLLFLALDKNMFGGSQVRVDVGQGGMLVKGNGDVQFVAKNGCVEISAHRSGLKAVDDKTMLDLGRKAAARVKSPS